MLPLSELRVNSYLYAQQPAINRTSQSHVDAVCQRCSARPGVPLLLLLGRLHLSQVTTDSFSHPAAYVMSPHNQVCCAALLQETGACLEACRP